MSRLMHRLTGKWPEPDYEAMHSSTEALGFALEEIAELYERAKLLFPGCIPHMRSHGSWC